MHEQELIFVYNADSGRWNAYMDMMHKVFSPKTYPCRLCDITYGVFSMRQEWADFIAKLPFPLQFLHRDEWEAAFDLRAPLPAVFLKKDGQLSVWLSAEEMNNFELTDLMTYIENKIEVV